MDETLAIRAHLEEFPASDDGEQYKSSFVALLQDARGAADRDMNGKVRDGCQSQSWLGATAYLILLDQIGSTFAIRGRSINGDNSIERALRYFSPICDLPTLDALYALRLTLAHDYALFNEHTDRDTRRHAYNFVADTDAPLVQLPKTPWDGVYELNGSIVSIPKHQITVVNLRKLGDLVEGVVATIRQLAAAPGAGDLVIRPGLETLKFHAKYGIIYRP